MKTPGFDISAPPPWEQGQPAQQSGDGFPVLEYLQLLWIRRKLIIAITVFASVVGWIQVNQIPDIYTASSKIMIGGAQPNVVNIEAVLTRDLWGDELMRVYDSAHPRARRGGT